MKKNLHYVLFAVFATISVFSLKAQNTYFREGFMDGGQWQTSAASAVAPNNAGRYILSPNGTWYSFGGYRTTGSTGACVTQTGDASHLRFGNLNAIQPDGTTNPPVAPYTANDSSYIVTPIGNFGINTITFYNGRAARRLTILKTNDTLATTSNWTSVTLVPLTNAGCEFTTVTINDAAAKRLKIVARGGTDTDIDSLVITSVNTIAPVKFGAIHLSQTSGFTKVTWDVISEINTEKYLIERSDNGSNFYTVGSLTAINAPKYIYIDNTPLNNVIAYYRIKAVDKDGSIGYSSVVKIGGKQTSTDIAIAPNPVKGGQLNVQLSNFTKGKYTFALYDAAGKQIFNKSIAVESANGAETLQLPSTVQNGAYQLQVTNGESRITKTVMVQ